MKPRLEYVDARLDKDYLLWGTHEPVHVCNLLGDLMFVGTFSHLVTLYKSNINGREEDVKGLVVHKYTHIIFDECNEVKLLGTVGDNIIEKDFTKLVGEYSRFKTRKDNVYTEYEGTVEQVSKDRILLHELVPVDFQTSRVYRPY